MFSFALNVWFLLDVYITDVKELLKQVVRVLSILANVIH